MLGVTQYAVRRFSYKPHNDWLCLKIRRRSLTASNSRAGVSDATGGNRSGHRWLYWAPPLLIGPLVSCGKQSARSTAAALTRALLENSRGPCPEIEPGAAAPSAFLGSARNNAARSPEGGALGRKLPLAIPLSALSRSDLCGPAAMGSRRRQPYLHMVYDRNQQYGDSLYRKTVDDLYLREGIQTPRSLLATRRFDDTYFLTRYPRIPSMYRLMKRWDTGDDLALRRGGSFYYASNPEYTIPLMNRVLYPDDKGVRRFGLQNKVHVHSAHDRHLRSIEDHRSLMAELEMQDAQDRLRREHNRLWFNPESITRPVSSYTDDPLTHIYRRRRPFSYYDYHYWL